MLKDRLLRQLLDQKWVDGDQNLAEELLDTVEIGEYDEQTLIYSQGDRGDDEQGYSLWMLFTGSVTLIRSGHPVSRLQPGECFGEFPLLDPGLALTVDAVAEEGTVLGRLAEAEFYRLTERHPKIGLNLSRILVRRLMENNAIYLLPNPTPRVFLGSSKEGVEVMRKLQKEFDHDDLELEPWTGDVFTPSLTAIESLDTAARSVDFAVLFGTPDDSWSFAEQENPFPETTSSLSWACLLVAWGAREQYSRFRATLPSTYRPTCLGSPP